MSEELKKFYRDYKTWLEAGAPDGKPFKRYFGLCVNLDGDVYWELIDQFRSAGLSIAYPFGMDNYFHRKFTGTQHLDPERIAWVEKHAA